MVEGRPSNQKLLDLGMDPARETLFGLYEGFPRTQRGGGYNFALPDRITIYQEPIEEQCGYNPESIKERVRITVLHEVAHFFGFSDPELEAMGWV